MGTNLLSAWPTYYSARGGVGSAMRFPWFPRGLTKKDKRGTCLFNTAPLLVRVERCGEVISRSAADVGHELLAMGSK